jgi:hypothetical protein
LNRGRKPDEHAGLNYRRGLDHCRGHCVLDTLGGCREPIGTSPLGSLDRNRNRVLAICGYSLVDNHLRLFLRPKIDCAEIGELGRKMKTKVFTGKDEHDLEVQIWGWRSSNPGFSLKKRYPVERLDLDITPVKNNYAPLTARDMVSAKIEYEE